MSDIGDPRTVQAAQAKAKEAEAGRAIVIRALATHRGGRDFLWWLLEQGSPFSSSMRYDAAERGDPMRTAYQEGWRGLGSMILGEIMRADAKSYVQMLTENRNVAELKKEKEDGRPDSDD